MKFSKPGRLFIFASLSLFIYSCSSNYEKRLIGTYVVSSFEAANHKPINKLRLDSFRLELNADKTFVFYADNFKTSGTWKASELREMTSVSFSFKNNINGVINSDASFKGSVPFEISIWNPKDFYCGDLTKLVFKIER